MTATLLLRKFWPLATVMIMMACESQSEKAAVTATSSSARPTPPATKPSPDPVALTEALWQQYTNPPLGLYDKPITPENNPVTKDKILLGYLLYFDPRLSGDGTISCASCHAHDKGWTDQTAVSTGMKTQKGTRNAPTVQNAAHMYVQFWDGRAATLEEQALGPLINPIEMGNTSHGLVVEALNKIQGYTPYFEKAFGDKSITPERIAQAIASFERTIVAANSRYDQAEAGKPDMLSASEQRGKELFFGKANCARCHAGPNFSDSQFHNLGVGMAAEKPDLGRFLITQNEADKGAFKTPTLRDLHLTAPYMHDGSQKTLEEMIEFYDQGGEKNPYLSAKITPLKLSAQEKSDLLAFLGALKSQGAVDVIPPAALP